MNFLHFWYPYRIFEWKIFFALISTFCKLWLHMCRKRLKKTENLFLWMCLEIYLGNHQRVCITKLLKSLYPNKQPTAHSEISVYIIRIIVPCTYVVLKIFPLDTACRPPFLVIMMDKITMGIIVQYFFNPFPLMDAKL